MNISVDQVAQPEIANHDSSVLDLAFALDCTSSMHSYIATAQQSIRTIVEEIVAKEKSDIRLALVEYRDHPPQDKTFVTRVHDFTTSVSSMKSWLDAAKAFGGGDTPEAVADALHQVLKLSWRDCATKICVFIADAPPHGLTASGDAFPKGCPDGIDPIHVSNQLAEKGVTMYMVGCEPSIKPYKDFFMAIAHMTGGQYVPLRNAALLAKVIIGGAQEEISLQRLMEEVNQEVLQQYDLSGGVVDEGEYVAAVSEKLRKKGARTKQLKMNQHELKGASSYAKEYAAKSSMAQVKAEYVANVETMADDDDDDVDALSSSSYPPPLGVSSSSPVPHLGKPSDSDDAVPRYKKSAGFFGRFRSKKGERKELKREKESERELSKCKSSYNSYDAPARCAYTSYDVPTRSYAPARCAYTSYDVPTRSEDTYVVDEDQEITIQQAQRMVKKSIAANKLK